MSQASSIARQTALRNRLRHPSGERVELTAAEVHGTVAARLARMAAAHADRLALWTDERTLTYAQLDREANRVAHALARSTGPDSPVAVVMPPCAELLVAICAAAKAGRVHAVLRPDTPAEHMAYLLQDLGDPLVLTTRGCRLSLQAAAQHAASIVDVADARDQGIADPLPDLAGPDTPFLIRYTSGSTGRPKGVVSAHADFLEYIRLQAVLGHFCAQDRFTASSDTYFGALTAVLLGASFYDFDLKGTGMPAFARALARHEVTYLMASTTAYRQLVRSAEQLRYPHLRYIHLYGEPPAPADIAAAQSLFAANAVFCNQYGTTESYIDTVFYTTSESARQLDGLPAGYPVENMDVLLLDEHGAPVATGQTGEIVVRSRYLTRGYWRRPELTARHFLPDVAGGMTTYHTGDLGRADPDGCLHYAGRADFQVKIRGQRVEITEIEATLRAVPGVRDAAVVARPGPNGDLRLIAYTATHSALTVSTVRRHLAERFPAAMVPATFVFLDALPLTPSQKVDRLALPEVGQQRPAVDTPYVAPRTPVEEQLTRIWAEVLGLEQVGIHDDFLELGGDSLLAGQVVTRAVHQFAADMPLTALYAAPTVAEMALVVTQAAAGAVPAAEIARLLSEVESAA